MRVSIIVPTFADADLQDLLAAIDGQDYPAENLELVVADNNPEQLITLDRPNTIVVHEPRPGSYQARNTALRHATGGVIAFTDGDCRPDPAWISAGVACLQEAERSVVGGRIQIVTSGRPTLAELYESRYAFDQKRYVSNGYAATANVLAWRADVEALGGFDSRLFSGGDKDFGRRATAAGLTYTYCPDAVVRHPARSSLRMLVRKARRVSAGSAIAARNSGRRGELWAVRRRAVRPPVMVVFRLLTSRADGLSLRLRLSGLIVLLYLTGMVSSLLYSLPVHPAAPRS